MQSFVIILFCTSFVHGIPFRNFLNEPSFFNDEPPTSNFTGDIFDPKNDTSDAYNNITSEFRAETSPEIPSAGDSSQTSGTNLGSTASILDSNMQQDNSTQNFSSSTHEVVSTVVTGRESQSSPHSVQGSLGSEAAGKGTTLTSSSTDGFVNKSSTQSDDDGESEGVARGRPSTPESVTNATVPEPETIYQKTLALISDTYTLSILVPIAAGIVFASTIIVVVATCKCLRRRCRRNRLRRKALPDSVKNLRPSDRARLLAESSDEEF